MDSQTKLPAVVVEIEGGMIKCVRSDAPLRVIILDTDIEGGDPQNVMEVGGEECYVHDYTLSSQAANGFDGVDAEFVEDVIDALSPSAAKARKPKA